MAGRKANRGPLFQARNNYYLNELGVAIFYPNVRGSTGRGKTFLALDNGFKREDSVRDIGALLGWIKSQDGFDPARMAVIGGSYGGYMVLASMVHYLSTSTAAWIWWAFPIFLPSSRIPRIIVATCGGWNTATSVTRLWRSFFRRSPPPPTSRKITKPLFVGQGKNDPRVPVTEAEQMVRAIRENQGRAWYLMATMKATVSPRRKTQILISWSPFNFLRRT